MGHTNKRTMSVEELAEKEKAIIDQFRASVADILTPEQNSDKYLRKWLIARRFNLAKAEDMLRKHVEFIKSNELDKITPDYEPHEATNYFYTTVLGYDKDGSVVRLSKIGASDLKAVTLAVPKSDALRHAFHILVSDYHQLKTERIDKGLPACEKQVYIMDLQGLSWRNIMHRAVVERTLMLLKSYEANQPENLKIAYVVNAPSFFSLVYNWLKSVLPDTIVSKIQILATNEGSDALATTMDLSIVPASMGGTRTDPDGDPVCPSLFIFPPGTPLPDRFLSGGLHEALVKDPLSRRTVVDNRGSFKVEVAVKTPASVLHWDFQTVQNDIRMGLNYRDGRSQSKEIIPVHRVDCHKIPESGRHDCENEGIYEIVFDNTYSWLTKKEIVYRVELTLPNENVDI